MIGWQVLLESTHGCSTPLWVLHGACEAVWFGDGLARFSRVQLLTFEYPNSTVHCDEGQIFNIEGAQGVGVRVFERRFLGAA